MKTFILLAVLYTGVLVAEGQGDDLFAPASDGNKKSGWSNFLAPSEKQLKKFQAIDLSKLKDSKDIHIRFLWEPTFNNPLLIRAFSSEEGCFLSIKKMSGKGGYDWGEVLVNKRVKLTDEHWKNLVKLYTTEGARKPSKKFKGLLKNNFVESMSGLDGSRWYLEVRDGKGYTVEGLPNPVEEGGKARVIKEIGIDLRPFANTCLELLKLSKIKVDLIY